MAGMDRSSLGTLVLVVDTPNIHIVARGGGGRWVASKQELHRTITGRGQESLQGTLLPRSQDNILCYTVTPCLPVDNLSSPHGIRQLLLNRFGVPGIGIYIILE